ncbi:MAG: transposase family protein, partial [Gaiellaceae bacterium]
MEDVDGLDGDGFDDIFSLARSSLGNIESEDDDEAALDVFALAQDIITGDDLDEDTILFVVLAAASRHIPRQRIVRCTRRTVNEMFVELGCRARQAYRMQPEAFWRLHDMLKDGMASSDREWCPNGELISPSLRLSASIRYFAGGSAYDIACSHGISVTCVYESVWKVVNAVHLNPDLSICFPNEHAEQQRIASGFKARSQAQFGTCVGAIDGLLVWISKPSAFDCSVANVGAKKFFCGRKHKFGLNLQGTCDSDGRFLDVSIGHPASCSDYLAFYTSELMRKLEVPGFLASDLHLFGDNAYVNTPFMATPYANVSSGPEDAFNFYHSQLRITVERAFGMLVHRWGILRKPFAPSISITKVIRTTLALCKLHNYCIDNGNAEVTRPMQADEANVQMENGISLDSDGRISALLDGGDHHDDVHRGMRYLRGGAMLPRELMLSSVI